MDEYPADLRVTGSLARVHRRVLRDSSAMHHVIAFVSGVLNLPIDAATAACVVKDVLDVFLRHVQTGTVDPKGILRLADEWVSLHACGS